MAWRTHGLGDGLDGGEDSVGGRDQGAEAGRAVDDGHVGVAVKQQLRRRHAEIKLQTSAAIPSKSYEYDT